MTLSFSHLKLLAVACFVTASFCMVAQNPANNPGNNPPPQQGATPPPPPGFNPNGPGNPPPAMTPPPAPSAPGAPAGWGGPGFFNNLPTTVPMNQGTINVMATGTDSQGVVVQIPLNISYAFNGATYNVVVNNAWDPYTQSWNVGVDVPAYSTTYFLNGFTYNYYAPLSIGTFYFNL